MFRPTVLLSLLAALACGCVTDTTDDGTPVAREATAPLTGRAIEFALEPGALDAAAIDAVGKHIQIATGAESLSISVNESEGEGTSVVVESWGRTAIDDGALVTSLRQQFPALANAMIAVSAVQGDGPADRLGDLDVEHDEDPEVVRQRVLEQLRSRGVQGDVKVHIDDDDEGRREVRVEVEDRKHD